MVITTLKHIENLLAECPSIKIELTRSNGEFFIVIQKESNKLTLQHSRDKTLAKAFKKMKKENIEFSENSR